jgi:hypothetical protein
MPWRAWGHSCSGRRAYGCEPSLSPKAGTSPRDTRNGSISKPTHRRTHSRKLSGHEEPDALAGLGAFMLWPESLRL